MFLNYIMIRVLIGMENISIIELYIYLFIFPWYGFVRFLF